MNNIIPEIYRDNPSAIHVIHSMIKRANNQFNPSLNQEIEYITGEPSDRTNYDYAGVELES